MNYKLIVRKDGSLIGTYDTLKEAWEGLLDIVGFLGLEHGFEYQCTLNDKDPWLTADEALKMMGVSRQSLDLAVNSGLKYILTKPRFKMYFKTSDVERYMKDLNLDSPKYRPAERGPMLNVREAELYTGYPVKLILREEGRGYLHRVPGTSSKKRMYLVAELDRWVKDYSGRVGVRKVLRGQRLSLECLMTGHEKTAL